MKKGKSCPEKDWVKKELLKLVIHLVEPLLLVFILSEDRD